jgi:hypothetical protein
MINLKKVKFEFLGVSEFRQRALQIVRRIRSSSLLISSRLQNHGRIIGSGVSEVVMPQWPFDKTTENN